MFDDEIQLRLFFDMDDDDVEDDEDYSSLTEQELSGGPTQRWPGSGKVLVLRYRETHGFPLIHDDDVKLPSNERNCIDLDAFVRGFTSGVGHTVAVDDEMGDE